ncbi:hypothetical protein RFI_11198, partial [Reticulomyxa filosa]
NNNTNKSKLEMEVYPKKIFRPTLQNNTINLPSKPRTIRLDVYLNKKLPHDSLIKNFHIDTQSDNCTSSINCLSQICRGRSLSVCATPVPNCSALSFLVYEHCTILNICELLKTQGVVVRNNAEFYISSKPGNIQQFCDDSKNLSIKNVSCFEEAQQRRNITIQCNPFGDSVCSSKNSKSAGKETHKNTISDKKLFRVSLSKNGSSALSSFMDSDQPEFEGNVLEFQMQKIDWTTQLETAIREKNQAIVRDIIINLNCQFWKYVQFAEIEGKIKRILEIEYNSLYSMSWYGSFLSSPSLSTGHNLTQKYLQAFTIQSINVALELDNAECFFVILESSSVFETLQKRNLSCMNRSRIINGLCYYLKKALRYYSKCCVQLLYNVWLLYIHKTDEMIDVFEVSKYSRKTQLSLNFLLKPQPLRDVRLVYIDQMKNTHKISQKECTQNKTDSSQCLDYLKWLASTIEPCVLADDITSPLLKNNCGLLNSHTMGRIERYLAIRGSITNYFHVDDVIDIIVDYDGFTKEKKRSFDLKGKQRS